MGLLQQNKAVFYHPCNDKTEHLKTQDWTEATPTYAAGKVSDALAPTTGDSIGSFGTESEFQGAGEATFGFVATLSATKFVVAYRDNADSDHGTAKVGTVSGADVTFGAETEFLSGTVTYISASALSATKFVVAYMDMADSNHGTAKVGTVSGTDMTFGAEAEFAGGASEGEFISAAALSETKFVVAYHNQVGASHDGKAKIGTVSGTDIIFGAEANFLSGSCASNNSVAALSSTKFIVAYRDHDGNLYHGMAKVGTVSGTNITFGAEAEFNGGATYFVSAAAMDGAMLPPANAAQFIVAYRDDSDSSHGTAKVGTVSGTDITFGAETEFLSTGAANYPSAAAISSTKFVVAYQDNADGDHGTARVGTVSGTSITFGAEEEFLNATGAVDISAAALSATNFAVAYTDAADAMHGTAKVGTLSSAASLASPTPGEYDSAAGATKVGFCGWFKKPSA